MKKDRFTQKYTTILISVKFLGCFWEFWSENITFGDDSTEFLQCVRDKYKRKFKNRKFKMRLYYPDEYYLVEPTTVKHLP